MISEAPDASVIPSSQCSSYTRLPSASSFWHGGNSSAAVNETREPFIAGLSLVRRTRGVLPVTIAHD